MEFKVIIKSRLSEDEILRVLKLQLSMWQKYKSIDEFSIEKV